MRWRHNISLQLTPEVHLDSDVGSSESRLSGFATGDAAGQLNSTLSGVSRLAAPFGPRGLKCTVGATGVEVAHICLVVRRRMACCLRTVLTVLLSLFSIWA